MEPFDPAAIAAEGVPVLCIDTCSLLDIFPDPTRDDMRAHERRAEIDIAELLESGTIACLVADQVGLEFAEHHLQISEEATKAVERLIERVGRVNDIHGALRASVSSDLRHLTEIPAAARAVAQGILEASISVPRSDAAVVRAMNRVNLNRAPAKDSIKDCLVVETYIDAIAALRAAGLQAGAVFLSSNTREYVSEARTVKEDILRDFDPQRIGYAANMAQARTMLGFS